MYVRMYVCMCVCMYVCMYVYKYVCMYVCIYVCLYVCMYACVYVVVVDSHIQRIVLATEETTVTQQVSHRPIKCQSRLWSQRGTKVNGSHHGDNPLLRPKGSKSRQKVMRLYKQWHRPISKRFIKPPYSISRATSIDSECCRLPTTNVLSKKPEKLRKNYAPTSFDQQVQDSQGHTLYRNKKK